MCKIACMGNTKFKKSFKELYKCTATEYIQHRRMSQAEHLLVDTDLTIGLVSKIVGYKSASRFSELFKKSTGLCPVEYRHLSKRS
ncbi:helix-turn-helix domain-containing protein [Clostridium sporogenes]|uniref:helix-turn-helix domain-containing protein n=1 Tax=Clostridium sporogenes TaxID=1509 RepID=UPI001FAD29FE|nr:AraC family transcriptional regulator [Clostridium sporogenes]